MNLIFSWCLPQQSAYFGSSNRLGRPLRELGSDYRIIHPSATRTYQEFWAFLMWCWDLQAFCESPRSFRRLSLHIISTFAEHPTHQPNYLSWLWYQEHPWFPRLSQPSLSFWACFCRLDRPDGTHHTTLRSVFNFLPKNRSSYVSMHYRTPSHNTTPCFWGKISTTSSPWPAFLCCRPFRLVVEGNLST